MHFKSDLQQMIYSAMGLFGNIHRFNHFNTLYHLHFLSIDPKPQDFSYINDTDTEMYFSPFVIYSSAINNQNHAALLLPQDAAIETTT